MEGRRTGLNLLPAVALVLVVGAGPFAAALWDSVHHDVYGTRSWAGLDNYADLTADGGPVLSLAITTVWATASTIGSLILAFLLAAVLTRHGTAGRLLFAVLLVPWGIPLVVAVPLWRAIVHGEGGLSVLARLGVEVNLLLDPGAAFLVTLAVNLWLLVPLAAFVLLGAMRKIPEARMEAAAVDGAGGWHTARHIILPAVRGPILALAVLTFIRTFKEFTLVYLMTAGGPPLAWGITGRHIIGATTTVGVLLYELLLETEDLGLTAAASVVLAAAVALMIGGWRLARRRLTGSAEPRIRPAPVASAVWNLLLAAAPVVFAAATLTPLFWMVRLALSDPLGADLYRLWPRNPGVATLAEVLGGPVLWRALGNTLVVAGITAAVAPLVVFLASAALTDRGPRWSGRALMTVQTLAVVGGIHSLIPLYVMTRRVGLLGSYVPLVLIYMYQALPFGLFTTIAFLEEIPASLRETAQLEGAGRM